MKTIYSTVLALGVTALAASAGLAQNMTVPVPGNAQVVNNGDRSNNNGAYWMCGGGGSAQMSLDGNDNVLYLDRNTAANVDGNNNTVYSVSPASIHVDGNNNVVYTNNSSRVTVNGNNNAVHAPTGVKVVFEGNNNTRHAIASLRFDYSGAPGGGCATITAVDNEAEAKGISVGPNPIVSGGTLTLSTDKALQGDVVLTDMQGRVVRAYEPGSQQLSLRDVPAGFYRVKVTVDDLPVTMPVVVQ